MSSWEGVQPDFLIFWVNTDDKGRECLWVTFTEFQRAAASPKRREPSLTGAVMMRNDVLIRAEML